MTRRDKIAIAGTIITILAGMMTILIMIGEKTNTPQLITLYAIGFGSGASIAALVCKNKKHGIKN